MRPKHMGVGFAALLLSLGLAFACDDGRQEIEGAGTVGQQLEQGPDVEGVEPQTREAETLAREGQQGRATQPPPDVAAAPPEQELRSTEQRLEETLQELQDRAAGETAGSDPQLQQQLGEAEQALQEARQQSGEAAQQRLQEVERILAEVERKLPEESP